MLRAKSSPLGQQRNVALVNLDRQESTLMIRILEMTPHNNDSYPMSKCFVADNSFKAQLLTSINGFNQFTKSDGRKDRELLAMCEYGSEYSQDVVELGRESVFYHTNAISMVLPADPQLFCQWLGSIEGAVNLYVSQGEMRESKTSAHYLLQYPDFSAMTKSAFIKDSLSRFPLNPNKPQISLSRYLAAWLVETVLASPKELAAYLPVSELLKSMLVKEGDSLNASLRSYLYPNAIVSAKISAFIAKQPDQLMARVLDANVPLPVKTNEIVSFIRSKIKSVKTISSFLPFVANKSDVNTRNQAHKDLNAWFDQLKQQRTALWQLIVQSVYGKQAVDGGSYREEYSEISLLLSAALELHQNGLMELKIHHSYSYKTYYARGGENYRVFEKELMQVCKDMGLELQPGGNWHQQIFFTPASTQYLLNCGLHYSKAYCQTLLRTTHLARLFNYQKKVEPQRQPLFSLFDANVKNMVLKNPGPADKNAAINLNSEESMIVVRRQLS